MAIDKFITVGELGSSSHTFIQGRVGETGSVGVDALTIQPTAGHSQGYVTDVEQMAHSLRGALADLKQQTGHEVSRIDVLGISLDQPFGICSRGVTEIRQGVVHPYDVESVMISAQTVNLPDDYKLIHVIPMYYEVDHQMRVQDPVGLSGKRLEGCFYLLAVPKTLIDNHKKVLADLSVSVDQMVLSPVCAKLPSDDCCLVIDFGWHSTRVAVYHKGACVMMTSVPWGGAHIDQDLSICCDIKKPEAERLKIEFMHRVLPKRLGQRDQLIFQVMEARYEEIIAMLLDKVSSEIEAATTVKVICVGGGYQSSFVDPIVKRSLNNSVIVHVGEDASSEDQEHWLAAQLFEYASSQQSQSKRAEQASVKQWLRRCKHWFEYHF